MALPSAVQAALDRLASFYNGNVRTESNPGGFDGDGHVRNFIPSLRDTSTVGQYVADATGGMDAKVAAAAESASNAASSAQAASDSADRAQTWDPTNYATKASPTFTGDPKAPTAPIGDGDTTLANTFFVQREIARRSYDLNLHYGS